MRSISQFENFLATRLLDGDFESFGGDFESFCKDIRSAELLGNSKQYTAAHREYTRLRNKEQELLKAVVKGDFFGLLETSDVRALKAELDILFPPT